MPTTKLRPPAKPDDITLDNLSQILPEAFADGKINWETLKQILGASLEDDEPNAEHFGLFWPGKRQARRVAGVPSKGTLCPQPGEGLDEDITRNIFIEGDNLEVLKLLTKAYAGAVKFIYIDPPYNTGSDFVYSDSFADPLDHYLKLTGQKSGEGQALTSNPESGGRFHSAWLSMMYPRLRLAKSLLREDGAIFISLDDTESANIRLLLNEVFGEETFIGVFPWRSRTAKADVPFGVSKDVEWVIAYAKSRFAAGREGERNYHKSDDYTDRWRLSDLTKQTTKEERPNSFFALVNPKNGAKFPANPLRTWSITEETFPDYYAKGKIVFPGDYPFINLSKPAMRVFESEDKAKALKKHGTEEVRMAISTYLPEKDVGRTEHGSKEIRELFDAPVFSFPKPVPLIKYFIENCTDKNALIMDFFAGSGTTAHAVMAQNASDDGARRYILVQLPEPLDPSVNEQKAAAALCDKLGKPLTLAEVSKERLRRAAAKVRKENPKYKGDLGFRSYKLAPSNYKVWSDYKGQDLAEVQTLFDAQESPLVSGWKKGSLLAEIMLLEGFPLDSDTATVKDHDKNKIISVTSPTCGYKLFVCLDDTVYAETARALSISSQDVFVCLDTALTDLTKMRLADQCNLKVI